MAADAQPAEAPRRAPRRPASIHHLRPAPGARTAKTRVGRGEASKGKTAGRGTKGTKARDRSRPPSKAARCRCTAGCRSSRASPTPVQATYQVVNLDRLAALYPEGGNVTPGDLVARGAVRQGQQVKVLGSGEAVPGLRVTAHAFSATAREKIDRGRRHRHRAVR